MASPRKRTDQIKSPLKETSSRQIKEVEKGEESSSVVASFTNDLI